jgi:V8-like Glu-specific endopeptidase
MNDRHDPITNLVGTETGVAVEQMTLGAPGDGEVAEPAGDREKLAKLLREAMLEVNTDGLLDIGAASYVRPQLEAVIGTDERVKVEHTTRYPWRTLTSLRITAADGSLWIGTAWFVTPRVLVTAGHCVYVKHSPVIARNGWVKKIEVMPGRDGSTLPFGMGSAQEFWTVKGWGEDGSEIYDYGAIILPKPFATNLGTFGFAALKDETLKDRVVNVAGYPGDKPQGTLWHDARAIVQMTSDKLYYEADTAGGQSGCPAYLIQPDGQRVAVGIHAYGGQSSNSATRISTPVYENIIAWMKR